jgi:DNA-binding MarR family transcriptional regulator
MSDFIVNTFAVRNVLVDDLLLKLNLNELRCYLYITRHLDDESGDRDLIESDDLIKALNIDLGAVVEALDALTHYELLY